MLNTYDGILSSHKKEETSNTCYNMVDPWHYTKWNKPVRKRCEIHLQLIKFIEMESRMVADGLDEGTMWNHLMGTKLVSVLKRKRVLETGCTNHVNWVNTT